MSSRTQPQPRRPFNLALAFLLLPLPALGCQATHATNATVASGRARAEAESVFFPVTASLMIDGTFNRAEGITFNGEGHLFVAANSAVWRVDPDGNATQLTDLYTNLGMAALGERDMLVADFGPTNRFNDGPNNDGIVWRVTPEGERTVVAEGIGDPNAILVREDGSFLVSDDATNEIFLVGPGGEVSLFTDMIDHPNGMVFSLDGQTLFVAQIFTGIDPIVPDDRIWAIPLGEGGRPSHRTWWVE
ncbi:SMP-30/gluconolactonase/LRE family protein, partial [Gemmatimonadota bacterium]